MLTTTTHPGSDLAEVVFSGVPEAESLAACRETLQAIEQEHGSLRLLVHYGTLELRGMTAAALWEDLKNVSLLSKIARCAIVADQKWVRTVSDVAAPLLPAELRTFTLEQEDEARAWIGA